MADKLELKQEFSREDMEQVCIEVFEDEGFDGLVQMVYEAGKALVILANGLDNISDEVDRAAEATEAVFRL